MNRKFCVYKHTTPSGKVYIGYTGQNPVQRWKGGSGYETNKHFRNAILKYGWDNIKHEILFDGLTYKEATSKEKELIALYKADDRRFGYNKTKGGEGTLGHKHSIEERAKMRKARRRNQHDIIQIDINTNEIVATYISTMEAERQTGINHVGINNCCKGKITTSGGYKWEYGKLYVKPVVKKQKPKKNKKNKMKVGSAELRQHLSNKHNKDKKPVLQYDAKTGELIATYESIMSASRMTNINDSSIVRCCKGKQHSAGGYKWMYKI